MKFSRKKRKIKYSYQKIALPAEEVNIKEDIFSIYETQIFCFKHEVANRVGIGT